MAESGIIYELVTPRGTITFNAWQGGANTDVIMLTDVTGIEPDVRKSYKPRPHRQGARSGRGLKGPMFPLLEGQFVHSGPSAQESMRRQLEAAAYSILDQPGLLRWQPSDAAGEWREVEVELNEKPDVRGSLLKTFQILLLAPKSLIVGETLNEQDSSFLDPGGGGGLTFDFSFDINWDDPGSTGAGVFVNAGDNDAWPLIRLHGPITNPTIFNNTSDLLISYTGVIPSGTYIEFNTWDETAMTNDGTSVDGGVNMNTSVFFPLTPGDNFINFVGSSANGALTKLTAIWKDSYV